MEDNHSITRIGHEGSIVRTYLFHCIDCFYDGPAMPQLIRTPTYNRTGKSHLFGNGSLLEHSPNLSVLRLLPSSMERKNFRNHCSHLFQLPLALHQCRILESCDKFLNLINLTLIAQEHADHSPS